MIPRVIHYCWFGGNPLPKDVKKYIESWKRMCPDYSIKQWDESNFDISSNSFAQKAYEAKCWAFVSDYARLDIIYKYGGIYLDTDVELINSLDSLLEYNSFFAIQQVGCYCATGLGFGARKGNEVVSLMLKEYEGLVFDENNKSKIMCPVLNTNAILKKGFVQENEFQVIDNNVLLPSMYMDPISPGAKEGLLSDESISIHHYAALWMPKKYKLKRKIINMIGQDRINGLRQMFKR